MEIKLENKQQYKIFTDVLRRALDLNYDLQYAQVGYNSTSGYVWMWSEDENYSIGIADYAWNRGEGIECILTCPETGEEFFADEPEDCYFLYGEYCKENELVNEYK